MLNTKVINTGDNSVYAVDLVPRSAQQAECLIGRHPNCDLVLDGPTVSRMHGRVLFGHMFGHRACFLRIWGYGWLSVEQ